MDSCGKRQISEFNNWIIGIKFVYQILDQVCIDYIFMLDKISKFSFSYKGQIIN